jgi:hypothetical protein
VSNAPEPPHTGLRPLSPHGEGYCTVCHFVVGRNRYGLLERHTRGAADYGIPAAVCEGSDTKGSSRIPYASRLAAFTTRQPYTWCPECRQSVKAVRQKGVKVYALHPARKGGVIHCPFGGRDIQKPV